MTLFKDEQKYKAQELILKQKEVDARIVREANDSKNLFEKQWIEAQKQERSDTRRLQMEKLAKRKGLAWASIIHPESNVHFNLN